MEHFLYSDLVSFCSKYNAYLSLSWGKQSIVIAHAVWATGIKIPCVFFSSPYADILHDFEYVKTDFLRRFPINYEERFHEIHLKTEFPKYEEERGFNGRIMGLCAVESKGRMFTCRKAINNVFVYSDGKARLTPLGRWTDEDICAYVSKYDIKLLDTYRERGIHERTSSGLRPNHETERAMDYLSGAKQDEIRRIWKEKGLL